MKTTVRVFSAATIVLLVAGTAACGGSDSSTSASGVTTLGVKNTTITVAAAGATPAPGTDGQSLSAGETLTTDATGFGIVNYPDKSLTRLDKNAVFTLDSVGTSATQPQVKATLKQGQAWNRVQKITGTDGQYEITTPYGTVAVRGTMFNIDCTQPPGVCTITAIEGVLAITPTGGTALTLTAPAQAVLTTSALSSPTPIPADFTSSPWAVTNTQLDTASAAASTVPTPSAPTTGSATTVAAAVANCELLLPEDAVVLGLGASARQTKNANGTGCRYDDGSPLTAEGAFNVGVQLDPGVDRNPRDFLDPSCEITKLDGPGPDAWGQTCVEYGDRKILRLAWRSSDPSGTTLRLGAVRLSSLPELAAVASSVDSRIKP